MSVISNQVTRYLLPVRVCTYINIVAAEWRMRANHVLYTRVQGTLNLSMDSPWIPSGPPEYFHTPAPTQWSPLEESNRRGFCRSIDLEWRLFVTIFRHLSYARVPPHPWLCEIRNEGVHLPAFHIWGGTGTHMRCRNIRAHRIKPGGSVRLMDKGGICACGSNFEFYASWNWRVRLCGRNATFLCCNARSADRQYGKYLGCLGLNKPEREWDTRKQWFLSTYYISVSWVVVNAFANFNV